VAYLIDGHNLIGATPGMSLEDFDDEAKLVSLLRAFLSRTRRKGRVIFDRGAVGQAPGLSSPTLAVTFAKPPRTADDVILDLIARERNPRGLVVVSGDARLQDAARRRGAIALPSTSFAEQMTAPAPRRSSTDDDGPRLSAEEVAAWERLFQKKSRRDG
jgi:predicted RNA-binding protein with PIN domain